jgi:predicted enzyme related to lactoylglutathione lyase
LEVSDLERSVDFYSKLFQREPTKVRSDYANFRMESPQLHLALVSMPGRPPEKSVSRHYGIELFTNDKLSQWLDSVQKSGLGTRVEEATTCCYAVADKFWAQDPDGHEWEFWVRHAEAGSMHEANEGGCGTEESTCCAPSSPEVRAEKSTCCAPGKCG